MARRKRRSGADDFFHWLVEMPWWIGPICAALVFAGLRWIFPAILAGGSNADLASKMFSSTLVPLCQTVAPYVALFVIAIWGMAEAQKLINRKRLDRQTGLDSVGELSWREFEELAAEAFRRQKYSVEVTASPSGDGGVDLVLRRNGRLTLVQCKHWKKWTVDVKVVRELRGVMASQGADYGIVVSYGAFTAEAEAFANENRITLIGGNDLADLIRSVQKRSGTDREVNLGSIEMPVQTGAAGSAAPACPRCGSRMIPRTARRGPNAGGAFWGCSRYPACKGTCAMTGA